MDLTPTYGYYTSEYGGSLGAEVFAESISKAESYVKYLIGWNEVDTPEKRVAYARACCAAVEGFALYGDGAAGGFTIGGFSMNKSISQESDATKAVREQVEGELLRSGLLFGGIA